MNAFDLLAEPVRLALQEFGLREPSRPQELAIPLVLRGKHLLLMAPTGTGKTEAAILPVFSLYLGREWVPGVKILYIAPLRALNRDMLARLERWGERLGIRIAVRHGDTPASERQRQARDPPDMLITTPETLQAILPGKRIREHLRAVRWVVVDEIHELADDKRGVQLAIGLERLTELAGEFQRLGLSATIGSPGEVAGFLAGAGREVEVVDASMVKEMQIRVESPMPTREDAELAERLFVEPTMAARLRRLRELMDKHGSTLIFVNTRETAEILGSRLRLWDPELPVGVHHGSLAREVRIEAEEGFRGGRRKGLICTSSMELGIDIGAVDLVVQYMSPRQVTRMVQRVGRSGHRIGELSSGVVLASSPDDIVEAAVIARRAVGGELEKGMPHDRALDVLAHQLAGLSLYKGRTNIDEALPLLKRAHPYLKLDRGEVERVLHQLQSQGLAWVEDGGFKLRKPGLEYYFTNLSMIPDVKRYRIRDMASRKTVGTLDEEFVASHGEPGATFICKGEAWQVVEVDHERCHVLVEPVEDPLGAIPAWEGELIPVPFEVAQEVGMLRAKVESRLGAGEPGERVAAELSEAYHVDKEAASWFVDQITEHIESKTPLPTNELLLIEASGEFAVLHACFGSLVNQTLAWVLAALLSGRVGASVAIKVDPYRIAFRFPGDARPELLEKTLMELTPKHLQSVLELTLRDSSMFRWRLMHVAKRFGAIRRDAELSKINLRRLMGAFEGTPIYDEAVRETLLEKLDVWRAADVLGRLHSGKLKLETVVRDLEGPTSLAWLVLNELVGGELVVPKRAEREILRALKYRLTQQRVRLHCMNCNDWSVETRVGRLPDPPACRKCGARFITLLPWEHRELLAAIRKHASGKRLTAAEKHQVKRATQIADLVLTYGKRGVVALSGRGVGPRAATKILARRAEDEDGFYREILRAERTYARTRRFWDRQT